MAVSLQSPHTIQDCSFKVDITHGLACVRAGTSGGICRSENNTFHCIKALVGSAGSGLSMKDSLRGHDLATRTNKRDSGGMESSAKRRPMSLFHLCLSLSISVLSLFHLCSVSVPSLFCLCLCSISLCSISHPSLFFLCLCSVSVFVNIVFSCHEWCMVVHNDAWWWMITAWPGWWWPLCAVSCPEGRGWDGYAAAPHTLPGGISVREALGEAQGRAGIVQASTLRWHPGLASWLSLLPHNQGYYLCGLLPHNQGYFLAQILGRWLGRKCWAESFFLNIFS